MSYNDQPHPAPPPPEDPRREFSAPPPCRPPSPRSGGGSPFLRAFLAAGCATILAPILLIGGFLVLVFFLVSSGLDELTKDGSLATLMRNRDTPSNIRTVVLRAGRDGAGSIAVVAIDGAISGSGSPLQGDGGLAHISEQLRLARENEDVKAVILQIDSPGGGLTASDLIHHEVMLLKESGKPVLAWAGGMMASGGYYIAVAADSIMASPTATVGSIGVVMQHFQVAELLRRLGVAVDPIVSGDRKDLGSPFREMTPDERRFLQDYIDGAHRRFVAIVAEGRGMPAEQVAVLADGGIMDADAALEKGLVDSIGYIQDAVAWAEGKAGEEDMRIIGYRRRLSLGDLFNEAGMGAASGLAEAAASADRAPRAMAVYEGSARPEP